MTQFGSQNEQGEIGEESDTVNYLATPNATEGTYASERDLLNAVGHDAYGDPDIPPDVLTELAGRFYTALEVDARKRAASAIAKVNTYMVKGVMQQAIQILRRNTLRRSAEISVIGDNTQPPLAFSPDGGFLSTLAGQLGAYSNSSQQFGGPYLLQPVGTQSPFEWRSTGDLWVIAPFAMSNPLYVTTTEYIDS